MKMQKKIFHILMFLPVPVTLISLVFLPDQIPAHYGSDNLVTRWGSKYETLLFPIFTIIFGLFMMGISKFSSSQEKVPVDLSQLIFILLGIFMIVFGNIMPKIRMNSAMGLRTKWSMKNEITWKKSQRFGGISFMIVGILIILACSVGGL